jgi:hypothetical protein
MSVYKRGEAWWFKFRIHGQVIRESAKTSDFFKDPSPGRRTRAAARTRGSRQPDPKARADASIPDCCRAVACREKSAIPIHSSTLPPVRQQPVCFLR